MPQTILDLDGGAADMDVDLSGLKVTDLDVNIGATDISIVLLETGPSGRISEAARRR